MKKNEYTFKIENGEEVKIKGRIRQRFFVNEEYKDLEIKNIQELNDLLFREITEQMFDRVYVKKMILQLLEGLTGV